ncbi:MAG: hypothetical protein Q7O66_15625 [Dehalococcoidia bacterium]|nr:hypothetical protein [Dehalococcoidia bacterium]
MWGLVVIYAAYRIAMLLKAEGRTLALVSAAWVAFLPQFTFITASVRSDSVANAVAALVFLCAALLQTRMVSRNRLALAMGALTGVGLLTKLTFVYIAPLGLIAIMLTNIRSPRSWIRMIAYFAAPVVVLTGGYYALFGEARSALAYLLTTAAVRPDALSWDYLIRLPIPLWVDLFYACFGWANVVVAAPWRWLAFGIWGIGTCVTCVQAVRVRCLPVDRLHVKIIAVLIIGLVLAFLGTIRINLSILTPQGRYIFPALAAWSVVAFWGLWRILPPTGREIAGVVVPCFMLIFNLYSLLLVLMPAYYSAPS